MVLVSALGRPGVILEGAKYTQGVSKITNEELETYNVEIKNRCEFRIDVHLTNVKFPKRESLR